MRNSMSKYSLQDHIDADQLLRTLSADLRYGRNVENTTNIIQEFYEEDAPELDPGEGKRAETFLEMINKIKLLVDGEKRQRQFAPGSFVILEHYKKYKKIGKYVGSLPADPGSSQAGSSQAGPSAGTPRGQKKDETDIPNAPKTGSRIIPDPKLIEASNQIFQLEQKIKLATAEIDKLKEEIKNLKEQGKKKDEEKFAIQIKLGTAESKVTTLESKVTRLESDITNLKQQNLALTSKQKITLEENAKQVSELRNEISKLIETIRERDKTIDQLKKDKEDYLNRIASLNRQLEQVMEKNREYSEKLTAGTSLDTSTGVIRRIDQLIKTEKQYQTLKTEMENLTVAIRAIEAQISPQKTQPNLLNLIGEWRSKMVEYQQRIASLERQASQAQSTQERDQLRKERDMARSTITDLERRILEIQSQGKAQQDKDKEELQNKLKNADIEVKRLKPLRDRIEKLQQQFRLDGNPAKAFDEFINKYENQNADLSRALQENEQLKYKITALNQLSQGAQEEITRLEKEISKLQQAKLATNSPEMQIALQGQIKKMQELENRISLLDAENIRISEEKDRYKKLSDERQKQIDDYQILVDRRKRLMEEYQVRYKDNLNLAGEYSEDIDNLAGQIQELDKQLAEKTRKISDLERQLGEQRQRGDRYKGEFNKLLDDSNAVVAARDKTIADLNARNEQQLTENDALARRLAAEQANVNALQTELNKQTAAVFQNRGTIDRLNAQIREGNQVVERLTNELNASQSALRQANVTIGNRQAEIDRLTQENADLLAAAAAAAAPVVAPGGAAPVVPAAAPAAVGGGRRVRAPGGGGGPPGGPGAAAVVAPAPNIFPGDNMATQRRGLDTTTISQIDEFLNDLEIAINIFSSKNAAIRWTVEPLSKWNTAPNSITNWTSAQAWLKQRGMVDLGDITENPKGLTLYMQKQNTVGGNVRTGMKDQLYANKILPLRFQPLTSEYKQGPVVKTIANLPGRERTVTSDLGTIVIPGQSNYALRRQGLNYVVTSAGKSQSFASERDANYFIQTGGFGRKTYGPITERVFGTPTKNISQAIY